MIHITLIFSTILIADSLLPIEKVSGNMPLASLYSFRLPFKPVVYIFYNSILFSKHIDPDGMEDFRKLLQW